MEQKSREMDSAEQAVFEMLNYLWNLNEEGKGDTRGMMKVMKAYKCSMLSYLGKYLKSEGWLITNKMGRNSIVSYLSNKRPKPEDAKKIVADVRKIKNDYATSKRELKESPPEVVEIPQATSIEKVLETKDIVVKEPEVVKSNGLPKIAYVRDIIEDLAGKRYALQQEVCS